MKRFALALAVLLAAGAVLLAFLSFAEINSQSDSNFGKMMDGTAHRPFQYRILVPKAVAALSDLAPVAWSPTAHIGIGPPAGFWLATARFARTEPIAVIIAAAGHSPTPLSSRQLRARLEGRW